MTIEEYLNNVTPSQKAEWQRIKKIVKEIAPEAEETIAYAMPAFKYKGKALLYWGAFKNHMSIFPTPGPIEVLSDKLNEYKTSKGAIQYSEEKPLPDALLQELIEVRIQRIHV